MDEDGNYTDELFWEIVRNLDVDYNRVNGWKDLLKGPYDQEVEEADCSIDPVEFGVDDRDLREIDGRW